MFVADLERCGLTDKEAKLYLTSLRMGPVTMQDLAAGAKVDRGTAYYAVKTLTTKGLFKKEGGAHPRFGVTHPESLMALVTAAKAEADAQHQAVRAVYDDLTALFEATC